MKWTLRLVLFIALVGNVKAQEQYKSSTAPAESFINIAVDEVNKTFVAPPQKFNRLKSAKTPQSSVKVAFHNFPEEAKRAFQYAVSIWESLINSPVPINVEAHWEPLSGNVMAQGRPSVFFSNFNGTLLRDTYYPVALAEKLSKKELNAGNPDIICQFNSNIKWYFGTDGNTPSDRYDFVSSVLHEITHGLGFSGFLKGADGKGFFNNTNNLPSIYDLYIFNHQNQKIADKSLFKSPSTELHRQLTSDNLKFCQASSSNQFNTIDWVFAPSVWSDGSSIYHLKGYAYGEENSLMTPTARKGEAIHDPGEITLNILAEIGWSSVKFDFEPFKDMEEAVAEIPVKMGVVSDHDENFSSVKIVYSTDNFSTEHTAVLEQTGTAWNFEGKLPLDFATGKIQYYIEAKTDEGRVYKNPAETPAKKFNLRIGPDYYVPDLFHNPVKVIAGAVPEMELSAEAKDNLGIKSVIVEYKINGIPQESYSLEMLENDFYSGQLQFPDQLKPNDLLEYRITATDNSSGENKRSFPALGFQKVKVYSPYQPVTGYATDFNGAGDDFVVSDFMISALEGFSGNALHTHTPYPVSALEDKKNNLTAQLKYPVIIQPNGQLSFDEVVLVEPGSREVEPQLWDFVLVEASKDGGINWLPLTDRYDSGINETWYSAFKNSFSNNTSEAKPHESMFVNRIINLTENTGLETGDTVLFRFRMVSDNSVNGFGWAVDNLKIQELQTGTEELFATGSFQVYPNPAKNYLFVEWSELNENDPLEIVVSDLMGKTVRRETGLDSFFSSKTQVDLSGISPGIYVVNISDGSRIVSSSKIVKN
jgi:hypothetical protein